MDSQLETPSPQRRGGLCQRRQRIRRACCGRPRFPATTDYGSWRSTGGTFSTVVWGGCSPHRWARRLKRMGGSLFITRAGDARPTLPTVSRYSTIPCRADPDIDTSLAAPSTISADASPVGFVVNWDLWHSSWPAALASTYDWFPDVPCRRLIDAGHFSLHGAMLKSAWSYPLMSKPICVGCISLGMVYFDTTPIDIMWGMVSIVAKTHYFGWWSGS